MWFGRLGQPHERHQIGGETTLPLVGGGRAAAGDIGDQHVQAPEFGGGVVDEPGKDTEDRGEIGETAGSDSGMSTPMIVLLSVGGVAIIVIVVLLMRRKSQGLPGTKGDDSGAGPKNG